MDLVSYDQGESSIIYLQTRRVYLGSKNFREIKASTKKKKSNCKRTSDGNENGPFFLRVTY